MDLNPLATIFTVVGALALVAGVALLSLPAGLIVFGLIAGGFGLFGEWK
jgi:hypothetical protein